MIGLFAYSPFLYITEVLTSVEMLFLLFDYVRQAQKVMEVNNLSERVIVLRGCVEVEFSLISSLNLCDRANY